ncbi:MAG TPA: alpha-1,4-glucan--maltose-1-phosphate maltosyltransferase [Solirubrobacteraceae bacterium]|jgi:starch synthase (maltosyl-transferring)|nr:alpha-1,4-glucan--maltose-1-phosphate maltosyltransferase [Solirubrobacteraceae bacterium]
MPALLARDPTPPLRIDEIAEPPPRIIIEGLAPDVDHGRFRAKRCVGDTVSIGATIFRDGHDVIRAVVRYCPPGSDHWREVEMARVTPDLGTDRWTAPFELDRLGRWRWTIEAWTDAFATWRRELERKVAAGQPDLDSELTEGLLLLRGALDRVDGDDDTHTIGAAIGLLADPDAPPDQRRAAALAPALAATVAGHPDRDRATRLDRIVELDVDRRLAAVGAWYELFPRSWGGFAGVRAELPHLADLGFDVVYLPPIHPIGLTNRKGRNDAITAGPDDPGSPWAIGSPDGGHTAIHPGLGTIDDFDALVAAADHHGIELALDFAIQCSADHPWLAEHPDWFHKRPDGTLKYAENPPKRYQDIYNVDFDCADWRALWSALRDIVLYWIDHGVRIFRVDNPHTKPVAFWEWLIEEVRSVEPNVLLLAEAFTRAPMMRELAKVGFSQSYTYFTWKNARAELTEYVAELAADPMRDYFRPNFFVNTPDILSEYLQTGGKPAFAARLTLAATLSPTYGIYSGFESFEHTPRHPGSEEYLNSEKYELKQRRLDGQLLPFISMINGLRRDHGALQRLDNVRFLDTQNDQLIAYLKQTPDETLIIVVVLDPHNAQEGVTVVPHDSGLPPAFTATDLLSGESFDWRLGPNYVRLDPSRRVAHILEVVRP